MSGFWGYRGTVPAFREFLRIGPIHLCRVPSWNDPHWPRFGFWRNDGGFSLRYRAYVLTFR